MKARLVSTIAGALAGVILGASGAPAQVPPPAPPDQAAPQFAPEQLDQMLAPIALYPDPLVGQILMAATYPLEVVQADRWLQDPNNASLKGDQLTAALEQQTWDPSVKSLVPFPQILRMMDGNLDWTERLGDAFLANQAAVMDSVQRLRQRAEAAGKLQSTPQEEVTTEGQAIMIEPASPEIIYVPVYDPSVVYGVWPYPTFPPYYFPGFFNGVIIGGFGFGWWGVGIVAPLWGWNHWDWNRHRIDIDRDRFAALNHQKPPIGNAWEHDPYHRHGVPYGDPGVRNRFAASTGAPDARRTFRGYPTQAAPQFHPTPGIAPPPGVGHVQAPPGVGHAQAPPGVGHVQAPPGVGHAQAPPGVGHAQAPPGVGHAQALRPPPTPRFPPTFESFGRGPDVRAQAERGHASRTSVPTSQPRGIKARPAPSAGSRGHR